MKNSVKKWDSILLTLLTLLLIFNVDFAKAQTQLTNLPTLFITTTNSQPVVDKVNYVPGNIVIKSADLTEQLSMVTGIRGRGNSTWGMAKKPYRIKLDKKTNILNLPAKAKSWVLFANYADKTLIRNAVADKISSILGFEFTPSARFVDLVLNGTYLGNYMLTDQMEAGPGRVNIDEQDSTVVTEPDITGGYLLEIDGFAADPDIWFTSGKGLKITVHSPDVVNQTQLAYIQNYINGFENTLFSDDFKDPVKGYRAIVDTTSLINWYIGCELTGNPDSFWSTYIYKKRSNDKLFFGPMWDYDIAFNNDNRLGDITQKLMRQVAFAPRTWIERLSQDKWFLNAVLRRWKVLMANNLLGTLTDYVNVTATLIDQSQQNNFQKWNILNTKVYLENYLFSTYGEGVDYLKTFLTNRIEFLNTAFADISVINSGESFVATNNYYKISNIRTNNVIAVNGGYLSSNASLVMWQPLETDDSQLWEIRPLASDYFRIVNKKSGLAIAGNGKNVNLIQVLISDSDDAQKWQISTIGTGSAYGIVNKKSTFAIDNSGGSSQNGSSAIEWDNEIFQNSNQQWNLLKMASVSTGLIENKLSGQKIEIYPNPATELVSIQFANVELQNLTITVFDVTGNQKYIRKEKSVSVGNHIFTILLSKFIPGMYLINVSNDKGENTTLKFTKQP